jgi:CheY-like chemotaxis protein
LVDSKSKVKRVLLVDPSIEELSRMATLLRERGMHVAIANGAPMACERAKTGAFDVLVASRALAAPGGDAMGLLDALAVEIGRVPPYVLVVDDANDALSAEHIARSDPDGLVARVRALADSSKEEVASPVPPSAFAGALRQTRLVDLLTMMSTEERSGTLAINTTNGQAEIRIAGGNVVDAVYMRLEGRKALCRVMTEADGSFSFTGGTPPVVRRIHEETAQLVIECTNEIARAAELRIALGDIATATVLASDNSAFNGSDLARTIIARLRSPATLDELLDEYSAADTAILSALADLHSAGRIRRLTSDAARVAVFNAEQLHRYRALASKSRSPGFSGPPRIVFAATAGRLAIVSHVTQRLSDASPSTDTPPAVPIPHTIASLRLGDDMSFDIVALPLVPAYAPLWPMTLAGALVVVRLDEAAGEALAEACAGTEIAIVDAQMLVGTIDEGNAAQFANLIRAALDRDGA